MTLRKKTLGGSGLAVLALAIALGIASEALAAKRPSPINGLGRAHVERSHPMPINGMSHRRRT